MSSKYRFSIIEDDHGFGLFEIESGPFPNGIFSFGKKDINNIQDLVKFFDENIVVAYRELVFDKIKDFKKNLDKEDFIKIGLPKLHLAKEKPLLSLTFYEFIFKILNSFEADYSTDLEKQKWLFVYDKYKTLAMIFDRDRLKDIVH